jgi:hypothetical protein
MARIRRCLFYVFLLFEFVSSKGKIRIRERMIEFTWALLAALVGHGELLGRRAGKSRAMELRVQRPALHRPVETLTFQAVTWTHPLAVIVIQSAEVALL